VTEPTIPHSSRKLRVGLLIDGLQQPRWVRAALEEVARAGDAEVVLLIRDATPPSPPETKLRTYARNRRVLLYSLYRRLDTRRFGSDNDPAAPSEIGSLYPDVPILDVTPRRTKHSDYFDDADVATIRTYDLDVAIRVGFRILRGEILRVARHGVWSYHHGDNAVNRGGPAGFWEVMEANPITGSILQVLSEDLDGGRVLYRSYSSTDRFSVAKNHEGYYWKTALFLARALRSLRQDLDARRTPEPALESSVVAYSQRLYTTPGNVEMAKLITRLAGRVVRQKLRASREREQWCLGYRRSRPVSESAVPDLTMFRFNLIVPPADRFWADPFPVMVDGRQIILLEEYINADRKGRISALELGSSGPVVPPVTVLEESHHLSYPFVFDWNGEHYMIPESADNSTVDLYRARRFPFEWEHTRTLIEGIKLYDATLAEIDGRWWMFASTATPGASSYEELVLYHADSPMGPWRPHRRNPVVSDVRCARPAGRLFFHGGSWYRPAQDGSQSYGYAVAIRRITRIDPDCYDEVSATRIDPTWDRRVVGVHTVNAIPGLTVIDARIRRSKFVES
jgi:hypothetical protein